jgi:hypothetical protein
VDTRRLTVAQAAKYLSTSESAIRHKVNRNTIPHEKDEETGRVFIVIGELENDELTEDNQGYTDSEPSDNERLIDMLTAQLEVTQRNLEEERAANRENRRLLAAALERIPAIEAPDEPGVDLAASEGVSKGEVPDSQEAPQRRSWWRRFFGVE